MSSTTDSPELLPEDRWVRPGSPGTLRRMAAGGVWALHTGLVALVLSAWLLPFATLWWIVLALAPLMQLQWWITGGVCVLTTLEQRLRGDPRAGRAEQGTFVGRLLRPLFGEVSPRAVDRICTGINWLAFAACGLRLAP